MAHMIEYFHIVNGKNLGEMVTKYDLGEPLCPMCQRLMEYEEFVGGQDLQGNDEWFCIHKCDSCLIRSDDIAIGRPSE